MTCGVVSEYTEGSLWKSPSFKIKTLRPFVGNSKEDVANQGHGGSFSLREGALAAQGVCRLTCSSPQMQERTLSGPWKPRSLGLQAEAAFGGWVLRVY